MIKLKISLAIICLLLAQISCYAPRREYRDAASIFTELQVPSVVRREQEFTITLKTEPNISCIVLIGYYNHSDDWISKDLPAASSGEDGVCSWDLTIPDEAKTGIGAIRGFVERGEDRTDFIPKTFCIEVCP